MPMREDASYCRPRLYDRHDGEREDDVKFILEALDEKMTRAMATGDKEAVSHASDLRRRILNSAGEEYRAEFGQEPEATANEG